jgi:hypothetical protein
MKVIASFIVLSLFYQTSYGQVKEDKCNCKLMYLYEDTLNCGEIAFFTFHEYWNDSILIIKKGLVPIGNPFKFENFRETHSKRATFFVTNGSIYSKTQTPIFSIEDFKTKTQSTYFIVKPWISNDVFEVIKFIYKPIERKLIKKTLNYKYSLTKSSYLIKNDSNLLIKKDSLTIGLYKSENLLKGKTPEITSCQVYFIPEQGFKSDSCPDKEFTHVYYKKYIAEEGCKEFLNKTYINWKNVK